MTDVAAAPSASLRARIGADVIAAALARPVDVAWLSAFRVLFGLLMAVSMLRFIGYEWIDAFFVRPTFHFTYWGFGWVRPLPGPWMHALFWALAGLALMMAAGLFSRAATLSFVVGFTYLQLIDVTTYLNHYYLASLLGFLLLLSPAHRAWSLDARRQPSREVGTVPAFWLYLFRFQVAVVYTFAGLAKAQPDWLGHGQPLAIWLNARTDMPWLGALFAIDGAPLVMSWAGFCFDSFIVLFLVQRRARPLAYVVVIAFHVLTRLLFPIGMFPFIMVLAALVFFDPGWPRAWLGRFGKERAAVVARTSPLPSRLGHALVALYCVVQVLMPLRFLAYGGNVLWHEQGMRFSWRVMVREKNGSITFHVRPQGGGRTIEVQPERYLTRVQAREMSGQPDLIWQLAQHIAADFAARGRGPVEVRVSALVSLNGRPSAPMIDPDVDLTRVADGLGKASWILPAPTTRPPRLRPST